ncbi:hypothetical protein EZS27_020052 [termite gut metagenome]|uniref:Uncharacterized protein n=1 Tax=termite gut metagenome TaxID=433724 RepID=A0A5J4REN0_9ZZZZ
MKEIPNTQFKFTHRNITEKLILDPSIDIIILVCQFCDSFSDKDNEDKEEERYFTAKNYKWENILKNDNKIYLDYKS